MATENQQEEILKQTKSIIGSVGDGLGTIGGTYVKAGEAFEQALGMKDGNDKTREGLKDIAGGVGSISRDVTATVLKAPGAAVETVGNVYGTVMKAPGAAVETVTNIGGEVMKAPGGIVKGIGKGHENIVLKDGVKHQLLNGKKTDLTKDVVSRLGKGNSVWIDGNQLGKMDKFAENMHKLATGKEGQKAPFTNILTKPKGDRADLVKATTENLRSDLHKIKDRLDANPGSFTPKQRKELEVLMDGIEKQGGIDKFMEKNYNLKEPSQSKEKSVVKEMDKGAKEGPKNAKENFEKQFKDIKKDTNDKVKDAKKEFSDSKESTPKDKMKEMTEKAKEGTEAAKDKFKQQFKDIKKDSQEKMKEVGSKFNSDKGDVKPVISGNQAPSMQAPSKSIGGR